MRTSWNFLLENFYINVSLTFHKMPNSTHLYWELGRVSFLTLSTASAVETRDFCFYGTSFLQENL